MSEFVCLDNPLRLQQVMYSKCYEVLNCCNFSVVVVGSILLPIGPTVQAVGQYLIHAKAYYFALHIFIIATISCQASAIIPEEEEQEVSPAEAR